MQCPQCNKEMPDGSAFCSGCGSGLTPKVAATQENESSVLKRRFHPAGCLAFLLWPLGLIAALYYFRKGTPEGKRIGREVGFFSLVGFVVGMLFMAITGGFKEESTVPPPAAISTTIRDFKTLEISRVQVRGLRIQVDGTTDLPDGTNIGLGIYGTHKLKGRVWIGAQTEARVRNGKFYSEMTIGRLSEVKSDIRCEAICTPKSQPAEVLNLIGANGENMKGTLASDSGLGFRTMDAKSRRIAIKIEQHQQ